MALYLEKAIFINRAPFEHLELDFKEKCISVLTAANGKGKTTILSHIVDAFYELAKLFYNNEFEGIENKYYRVSSSVFSIKQGQPSIVYFRFISDNKHIDYVDIREQCSQEYYDKNITISDKIQFSEISGLLTNQSNIKHWKLGSNNKNIVESIFNSNLVTYFPSYRYEMPSFLNNPYQFKIDYKLDNPFAGYLTNQIEVITGIRQIANWLMDVVLDWEVYKKTQLIQLPNGTKKTVDITPEHTLWNNINNILKKTLSSKKIDGNIRFGIGKRNNAGSRLAIVSEDHNGIQTTISPNIFCLSSGELAIICCFGELLRQADRLKPNVSLQDIQGIVLIDEVDKHLHIKLQKEILPKLFNLFPNVQFIVSSHSPFLNMGLADETIDRTQIIDLDNSGIACEPTNNDLYREVYEMMINENQRFADKYKELKTKIHAINKPIVITEGKTDWKHVKSALQYFKENHEYEDVDVEILEYDFDFGDSKLHALLNQYKTFPHRYKVIGVFDCDEANGKGIHSSGGIKKYGDNIWGISIPIPEYRNYNTGGISIEFLYKDEDLKKQDENGRRLYVTSEFNENGRLNANHSIGVKNNHDVKNYITPEKEKIQADEVIDVDGNSLALSKEQFASNILERKELFANVNYDGFRPLFDRLKSILQQ